MLRIAYKKRIQINSFSLSGNLYPLVDNGHGGFNEDEDATPEEKSYTNAVRISHLKKGIKKVESGKPFFIEQRVYYMISDYETIVDKRLEFVYNGINLKVMQRKEIIKYGFIIGYEYELKELTEAILYG